jgi:outer membrane protein assembly factor BamB
LKKIALGIVLLELCGIGIVRAGDWPQWLGPNRDGISRQVSETPLIQTPQTIWNTSVGVGVSSIVVSGGQAFAMGHVRGAQDRGVDTVYSFDAETGAVLWAYSYDCLSCRSQDVRFYGPRSTPTVDGERLFTLSLEGHLFCFEVSSGRVLWHRDIVRDLDGRIPVYGYCCSPLVYDDRLILELNAKGAAYVALNKWTGEVIWRSGLDLFPKCSQLQRTDRLLYPRDMEQDWQTV